MGGSMMTNEGYQRFVFYGGGGVPFVMFDGADKLVGVYLDDNQMDQWYRSYYDYHRTIASPLTIAFLSYGYGTDTACVKVRLTLEQDIDSGYACGIVLWEDHVFSLGTDWRFTERAYEPKDVTITKAGETQEFSVSFPLQGNWNTANLGCTVIVQHPGTKVVAQANAIRLVAAVTVTPASLGRVKALYR